MSGRTLGQRVGKTGSLLIVIVAYVVATGLGDVAASAIGARHAVWALGVGYAVAALVIYIWSLALDNGSMFDAYWSVVPALAALWLAHASSASWSTSTTLIIVSVWVWALRLTSNWARDWPGLHHEDWRYLELYSKGPKPLISLGAVHLFPALMVFLISLPLVPALVWPQQHHAALEIIAFVLGIVASLIEFTADEQMRSFRRTKQPGEVMARGLWKYSRHPNYFGEILFWWSVWLFVVARHPAWWWTVVGPVALPAMFLGASIPMIDERSSRLRPGFTAYAERTSRLVPWPPKSTNR